MYAGQLVEEGDVFQIFENPVHPYTRLLLEALPRISKRDGELATIPGTVPKLIGEITGCRFANRCSQAEAICFKQEPVVVEIESGHSCACNSYPAQVMGGNKQ